MNGTVASNHVGDPGPASADIDIVDLTTDHLEALMKIDAQVYPEPWSRRLWLTELGRQHRTYLAAELDGEVVGYIGALRSADDLHVMTVVARPDRQQQGIGSLLLRHTVEQGIATGATAMTLEVRVSNTPAQALYRRFGMVPAGVRRGYYEPDREDALVMWVRDIDSQRYRDRLEAIAAGPGAATTAEIDDTPARGAT